MCSTGNLSSNNNNNLYLYSAINPIDAIVQLRFTANEIKINVRSCKNSNIWSNGNYDLCAGGGMCLTYLT